ncbi:MAG: hypothetical protein PHQ60_12090 [Sideroxydans sp.]|nr:hypothetical protein [Sideroxydans sp.]
MRQIITIENAHELGQAFHRQSESRSCMNRGRECNSPHASKPVNTGISIKCMGKIDYWRALRGKSKANGYIDSDGKEIEYAPEVSYGSFVFSECHDGSQQQFSLHIQK